MARRILNDLLIAAFVIIEFMTFSAFSLLHTRKVIMTKPRPTSPDYDTLNYQRRLMPDARFLARDADICTYFR